MKYRIVTDAWLGYEVQARPHWYPFWFQIGPRGCLFGTNTHRSVEEAEEWTKHRTAVLRKKTGIVVKQWDSDE